MTKKELLKKLKDYPDNTRILINGYEGGYDFIQNIHKIKVYYSPSRYCGNYKDWNVYNEEPSELEFEPIEPDFEGLLLSRSKF